MRWPSASTRSCWTRRPTATAGGGRASSRSARGSTICGRGGPPRMVDQHRPILDLLAVERVAIETSREHREFMEELRELGVRLRSGARAGDFELRWTEDQARASQLLHILPHELGHHYDRITSRKGRRAGRGEPYAEAYANRVLEEIWPAYLRAFRV